MYAEITCLTCHQFVHPNNTLEPSPSLARPPQAHYFSLKKENNNNYNMVHINNVSNGNESYAFRIMLCNISITNTNYFNILTVHL